MDSAVIYLRLGNFGVATKEAFCTVAKTNAAYLLAFARAGMSPTPFSTMLGR